MTNSTHHSRSHSASLFLPALAIACIPVQGSLAGPSASHEEPETHSTATKAPLEGITFAEASERLYLPVLELGDQFGWKVKPGEKSGDLVVNGVLFPRSKLRRLVAGTSLVSLQDLSPLGITVTWDAAAQVARVQYGKKSFAVRNGPKRVDVNQRAQRLRAWQGSRKVLDSRVSTGRRDHPTPNGYFTAGPLKKPMVISRRYDNTPMPWSVQVRGNILIHGSRSVPLHADSHGCIRLPLGRRNPARWFYDWVTLGTPITIRTSWPAPPAAPESEAPAKHLPVEPPMPPAEP